MPGLLTLTTDLKSLKYGADRPGGGSSEQPYIVNDINNPTNVLGFDDGLVRGGAVGAAQSGATDTIRIGKFFLNNPLFIVKQVGLQFSNPRLEVPKDPANILMGGLDNILAVGTNGFLEPTRTYNLGVNTIAQVPVNAFGAHFNRHGLLPVQTEASKYEAVATANNESHNRLVKLTTKFSLGTNTASNVKPKSNLLGGLIGLLNSVTGLNIPNVFQNKELIIDQYLGGPGSAYGIGGTIINRTSFTDTSGYKNSNGSGKSFITKDFIKPSDNLDFGNPNFTNYISARTTSIFANPNYNWNGISLDVDENLRATLSDYIPNDYTYRRNFKYGIAPNSQGNNVENKHDTADGFYSITAGVAAINSSSIDDELLYFNNLNLPNNVYGQDTTYAEVYNINEDNKSYNPSKDPSLVHIPPVIDYIRQLGVSNDYFNSGSFPTQSNQTYNSITNTGTVIGTPFSAVQYPINVITPAGKYSELQKQINKQQQLKNPSNKKQISGSVVYVNQFGIYNSIRDKNGVIDNSNGSYSTTDVGKIAYSNGIDKPITLYYSSWGTVSREQRVGSGRKDSINLTPLFDAKKIGNGTDTVTIDGTKHNIRDLVKFRIQAVNTDGPDQRASWMIFRAYITDLLDDVNADWTDIKYAGRGDKFYIYNGFTRKMSVSFKVAALSRDEMKPMYQKLNYLMSNLMPDYGPNGGIVMRGPLMRMTIGNWIDGQLCVLNSINYKIPSDSPWEIALDEPEGGSGNKMLILPHIVEVSLSFTPIGSQTRAENKLSQKSAIISNIAQNWNGGNNNEPEFIYPNINDVLKDGEFT